jgi:hypothetical protein
MLGVAMWLRAPNTYYLRAILSLSLSLSIYIYIYIWSLVTTAYGRSPAAIVGSNPNGGMDVCLLCVVCDELITRPEDSYRLWRVVLCDHATS